MGLYEARGNLARSYKDLLLRWRNTRAVWNDEQAENLERDVLQPVERAIRTAGEAIDQMTTAVNAARRDCAP